MNDTIAEAVQRIDALEAAVAAVAAIHSRGRWAMGAWFCNGCEHRVWPCETSKALEKLR